MTERLRLGVNIDHVATLRNARGGQHPDTVRAARMAVAAGADGITIHLREDRRHIRDDDVERLAREITQPINLEMAATVEMVRIAVAARPHAACLVPEKRTELTTEGGLDAAGLRGILAPVVRTLADAGIQVALFVDPDERQLKAAQELGAPAVELHTGTYCNATGAARAAELTRLACAAAACARLGLECHAGHGLDFENVAPIAGLPQVVELNIGHFLVGEALFVGLDQAIRRMRGIMDQARAEPRR
ncbi:MAG: pyridoxine 5'-phosphate synthase [Alphaproteobacteria bacterium]|nr:pyridoxine 5'-phosphate synthase [Alphaproteobacteria bacterium]